MAESVVGPWARDKLDRLGKYLRAYTTIMNGPKARRFKGYYYVDAFAGPGDHEIRQEKHTSRNESQLALIDVAGYSIEDEEQRQFLAGSPRIALDLEFPFTHYIFVEHSADRIAALERLRETYGNTRSIVIRHEDCPTYLRDKIARHPKIDWHEHRAIVFLDPFGMQVKWQTIVGLASTRAIEVFLNFPVGMAIQRLLPRNPKKLTDNRRRWLDEYFGSTEWMSAFYRREQTLFGDTEEKIEKSGKAILRWYRGRLKDIFPFVSRAALIRNTRGGHLYYLLLASHNKTGVKIANDILSAGETI